MNNYNELKNIILGEEFPWFFMVDAVKGEYRHGQMGVNNFPFFSHVLLDRPGDNKAYAVPVSNVLPLAERVFREICEERKISYKVLYRVNANMTLPSVTGNCQPSPLHLDHSFPHKNMLVYLTDCNGGPTMVRGQDDYYGKEDDVYVFEGLHQHKLPTSNRRIVLVYTFI